MEIEGQIIRKLETELSKILDEYNLPTETIQNLAKNVFNEAIEISDLSNNELISVSSDTDLTSIKWDKKNPPKMIHFNLASATTALGSILAGIVSYPNPWLISASILSALGAIRGIQKPLSTSEAIILWILLDNATRTSLVDLEIAYHNKCEIFKDIKHEEFELALHSLYRLGCLKKSEGFIQLVNKVIFSLN